MILGDVNFDDERRVRGKWRDKGMVTCATSRWHFSFAINGIAREREEVEGK